MNKIPYPTVTENGQPTHVLVPVEDFLRLVEDAEENYPPYDPRIAAEGGSPAEVTFSILDGENPLKAWRTHLKMTQEQAAEKMGVSRPAYTQMEQVGRPQQKTLERAAKVFGTTVEALTELYED